MELVKKVVAHFLKDSPVRIANIDRGMQENHPETIFLAAHSLKSASTTVGAMILADMCKELELNARRGLISDVQDQLARIESEYRKVVAALESYINLLGQD
ncbi:MAG: Hpt domain-containing protein [Deltaproteobacteria bacterium]|nr:Hpt domain-containing protein [Deltaproteobacteria bacterium]